MKLLRKAGATGSTSLPPLQPQRPRSALQQVRGKIRLAFIFVTYLFVLTVQSMDEVVAPDMVPGVESWLLNANKKGSQR